jgi:predicted nucleic acid-binding protein
MRKVFVDTNILIFATSSTSPFHADAVHALKTLINNNAELVISSQVLREYVCNMTAHNFAARDAIERNVLRFQKMKVLADDATILQRWFAMTQQFAVSGKAVYDCNIAATMLEHGITEILTHNVKDFTRYEALLTVIPLLSTHTP